MDSPRKSVKRKRSVRILDKVKKQKLLNDQDVYYKTFKKNYRSEKGKHYSLRYSNLKKEKPQRKRKKGNNINKKRKYFLQDGFCLNVAPELPKCRECQRISKPDKVIESDICLFQGFRRLMYQKGQVAASGFSDPFKDPSKEDLNLWLPSKCSSGLDVETSIYLLAQVGDQFCDLLQQEKEAISINMNDQKVAWKKVVQGVREMCDVCITAIFNFHWACGNCGFVVCIDCYKQRKNGSTRLLGTRRVREHLSWPLCVDRQSHKQEMLLLSQIIAGDSLNIIGQKLHKTRQAYDQKCKCENGGVAAKNLKRKNNSRNPLVPHMWLCSGTLLRLLDLTDSGNKSAFQEQWKKGKPVLVSDVTKHLNPSLWTPESFLKDFGETKTDLIDYLTGKTIYKQPMKKFWNGFNCFAQRLKNKNNKMILKIKDWPPSSDFDKVLPSRFNDLMRAWPLTEYTSDSGGLNLVTSLPDCFVRPDLGPKMYAAYGSGVHYSVGTTNLHLDISDAVNILVFVSESHSCQDVYKAIDESGCDLFTRERVKTELPGALWHIYEAKDSDKIRKFLHKISVERNMRLQPKNDPIHDQTWYLDSSLRKRLLKEYRVKGYTIVQFLGDAVFIPAGASHQVRNLQNCIKVAKDFVSPENISQCFHLTHEFRGLSDSHGNHEDKLQIKNILYHVVKDSLSVLEEANASGT